jgi:hypothetical protein
MGKGKRGDFGALNPGPLRPRALDPSHHGHLVRLQRSRPQRAPHCRLLGGAVGCGEAAAAPILVDRTAGQNCQEASRSCCRVPEGSQHERSNSLGSDVAI